MLLLPSKELVRRFTRTNNVPIEDASFAARTQPEILFRGGLTSPLSVSSLPPFFPSPFPLPLEVEPLKPS